MKHTMIAYLATLGAIVRLVVVAAVTVMLTNVQHEAGVAKLQGALAFISAGVTGLIGVIGTFRPRQTDNGSSGKEEA